MPSRVREMRRRFVRLVGHAYLLLRCRHTSREPMVRLGSGYGGWYAPTQRLNHESVVYCVGTGTDVTFDLSLIRRFCCAIHAFDPMPEAADYCATVSAEEPRFIFHPWALAADDGMLRLWQARNPKWISWSTINLDETNVAMDVPCRTLHTIMADLGHTRIDMLKMDIEGAEFAVIDAMLAKGVRPITLAVEFHGTTLSHLLAVRRSLHALAAAGYRVAAAEIKPDWNIVLVRA